MCPASSTSMGSAWTVTKSACSTTLAQRKEQLPTISRRSVCPKSTSTKYRTTLMIPRSPTCPWFKTLWSRWRSSLGAVKGLPVSSSLIFIVFLVAKDRGGSSSSRSSNRIRWVVIKTSLSVSIQSVSCNLSYNDFLRKWEIVNIKWGSGQCSILK
jgi:hypothetical protein